MNPHSLRVGSKEEKAWKWGREDKYNFISEKPEKHNISQVTTVNIISQ